MSNKIYIGQDLLIDPNVSYTKAETDQKIDLKADDSDVFKVSGSSSTIVDLLDASNTS